MKKMPSCHLCEETIEEGDVTISLSCCSALLHSECHVKNILNHFHHNVIGCVMCGQTLYERTFSVPNDTPTPELSPEVVSSPEFQRDFKNIKDRQKKTSSAKKDLQKVIRETTNTFKQQTFEAVTNLKNIKRNTLQNLQNSGEYKAYQSAMRGFQTAKTNFTKKYGQPSFMYLWSHLKIRRSWYRYSRKYHLTKNFYIRI